MASPNVPKVRPAQLGFLAIYNPSLGKTDELFREQIVFYYNKDSTARSREIINAQQNENERLRHIGLAQGILGFAKTFSNGAAVDSVETEKTRIVMKEIEAGWWILASVDLTCLPTSAHAGTSTAKNTTSKPAVEYSSREVSPPALLLQQLTRAHNVFCLHHGPSLSDLFSRLGRDRFCNTLDRFWTRFSQRWDVLLHANPGVDVYGALKLAAGGELGMGVGEEEWGSGEREVFEEFARRTDGLVDMMVSRYGEPAAAQMPSKSKAESKRKDMPLPNPWMGSGSNVDAADGVVFSGTGAVARESLRDISHWMESMFAHGEYTYGVRDNPSSDRKRRRRRQVQDTDTGEGSSKPATLQKAETQQIPGTAQHNSRNPPPPGIPRPIVSAVERSLDKASRNLDAHDDTQDTAGEATGSSITDPETWKYYLTLGYGTSWGKSTEEKPPPPSREDSHESLKPPLKALHPEPDTDKIEEMIRRCIQQENKGHFLVGLKGDMDQAEDDGTDGGSDDSDGWNSRIFLRTLHVKLSPVRQTADLSGDSDEAATDYDKMIKAARPPKSHARLRVVVYVHRPFIYTFLFKPRTESLTLTSFYRNLHTYFAPLHRPLSTSTSPSRVASRISSAVHPFTTSSPNNGSAQPIFDLVYDPQTFTVHSSIPSIPEPGTLSAEGLSPSNHPAGVSWTRVEALNVHSALLDTVSQTRKDAYEIERTGKTSRGWWVVWMRLPASAQPENAGKQNINATSTTGHATTHNTPAGTSQKSLREAFLVRRARDAGPNKTHSTTRSASGLWRIGLTGSGEKAPATSGHEGRGVAEGIGIDARKYIETLLSLNR